MSGDVDLKRGEGFGEAGLEIHRHWHAAAASFADHPKAIDGVGRAPSGSAAVVVAGIAVGPKPSAFPIGKWRVEVFGVRGGGSVARQNSADSDATNAASPMRC